MLGPNCLMTRYLDRRLKLPRNPAHELRGSIPYMGASINTGPQNRPKYIMILIIGTTTMGPLICGNSHIMVLWTPR